MFGEFFVAPRYVPWHFCVTESGAGLAHIAKVNRAPACQADALPLNESAGLTWGLRKSRLSGEVVEAVDSKDFEIRRGSGCK